MSAYLSLGHAAPTGSNLPRSITDVLKASTNATNTAQTQMRRCAIAAAIREVLLLIGEDLAREGLVDTPKRFAQALLDLTAGYAQSEHDVFNGAVFSENTDELVIVRDIEIASLCEHHMLPFTGKIHIGYIPNGQVLSLSKLARIAEVYSRRLQVQERLTREVAMAVERVLQPRGVAVVVECTHSCMMVRVVQKTGAVTLTQSMKGVLRDDPEEQRKFWALLG